MKYLKKFNNQDDYVNYLKYSKLLKATLSNNYLYLVKQNVTAKYDDSIVTNDLVRGHKYNVGDLYVIRPLGNGEFYRYVIHTTLAEKSCTNFDNQYSIYMDLNTNEEFNSSTDIICGICFMPDYLAPDFKSRWLFLPYPVWKNGYDIQTYGCNIISLFDVYSDDIFQYDYIERYDPSLLTCEWNMYDATGNISLFGGINNYQWYLPSTILPDSLDLITIRLNYNATFECLPYVFDSFIEQPTILPYNINDDLTPQYYLKAYINSNFKMMSESFDGEETFNFLINKFVSIAFYDAYRYMINEFNAPKNVYMPSSAELIFLFKEYDMINNILTELLMDTIKCNGWVWQHNILYDGYTFDSLNCYIPSMTFIPFVKDTSYNGLLILFKFNSNYELEHEPLMFSFLYGSVDVSLETFIFKL